MEDMRIVSIIVSPLQFLQVAVQMLDANLMERTNDGSLEQAPHALDPVGVNVTDNPLLGGVADGLMSGIRIPDPDIGFEFICVDGLGLILDVPLDEVKVSTAVVPSSTVKVVALVISGGFGDTDWRVKVRVAIGSFENLPIPRRLR